MTLDEMIELDLSLMVDNRGILGDPYFVPLLLNHIEQDEGVSGRIEVIEVGPVLELASEVLIAAPQDGWEHLM